MRRKGYIDFKHMGDDKRDYIPVVSSEEANICLRCPLPDFMCGKTKCMRYEEEKSKLKIAKR